MLRTQAGSIRKSVLSVCCRLRAVDRLIHIFGKIHLLELILAGERHLKAVGQVKCHLRVFDADLQNMFAPGSGLH